MLNCSLEFSFFFTFFLLADIYYPSRVTLFYTKQQCTLNRHFLQCQTLLRHGRGKKRNLLALPGQEAIIAAIGFTDGGFTSAMLAVMVFARSMVLTTDLRLIEYESEGYHTKEPVDGKDIGRTVFFLFR